MRFKIFGSELELQGNSPILPHRFPLVNDKHEHRGWVMLDNSGHWGYEFGTYRLLEEPVVSEIVDEIAHHPDWVKLLSIRKIRLLGEIPWWISRHQGWLDEYTSGLEYLKGEARF